jgi:hypothetical protein
VPRYFMHSTSAINKTKHLVLQTDDLMLTKQAHCIAH